MFVCEALASRYLLDWTFQNAFKRSQKSPGGYHTTFRRSNSSQFQIDGKMVNYSTNLRERQKLRMRLSLLGLRHYLNAGDEPKGPLILLE